MSEIFGPIDQPDQTQQQTTSKPVQADALTAGEAVKANSQGTSGEISSKTTVSNMGDLKEKAPEVYNEMLKGLATNIVNKMRDHQERLKKLMREYDRYS